VTGAIGNTREWNHNRVVVERYGARVDELPRSLAVHGHTCHISSRQSLLLDTAYLVRSVSSTGRPADRQETSIGKRTAAACNKMGRCCLRKINATSNVRTPARMPMTIGGPTWESVCDFSRRIGPCPICRQVEQNLL
jgi:hypothetical protein